MRLILALLLLTSCYQMRSTKFELPKEEERFMIDFFQGSITFSSVQYFEFPEEVRPTSLGFESIGNVFISERIDYLSDPVEDRPIIIHELVHVWQQQHFGPYAFEDKSLPGLTEYFYTLGEDKHLTEYTVEQQAQIITDYYRWQHVGYDICQYAIDCPDLGLELTYQLAEKRYQELLSYSP